MQTHPAFVVQENGWDNTLYHPPLVRPEITHHGPDPNESYRNRLIRFGKVSAGVTMHPFCEIRQRNDLKDMEQDINKDLPNQKHPYLRPSPMESRSPTAREYARTL